jgi:oligosaccharide repeat unit polymerase
MFASYSCGHLYAFSDWYGAYMAAHWDTGYQSQIHYTQENSIYGATYGLYTFAPLFRFFGSTKVIPPDTFDDYYEYGNILTSNIYTMFRGVIEDFGLLGCLLFMFLMGLLNHWSFNAMLENRKPALTVTVFTFFIGFFYASFGRSIFSWSGIYFTFLLLCAILVINKHFSDYLKASVS